MAQQIVQTSKPRPCIVCFDDEQGLCYPYGFDSECEGALSTDEPVIVFPNYKAARQAVLISRKQAELLKTQGKPENTDFTEAIRFVKIREVKIV